MAWLNDYQLARLICEAPVPVLTGIGHERDNTILDEVANQRFDTPSKVIAGIERTIRLRVDEAQRAYELIRTSSLRAVDLARRDIAALESTVRQHSQRQLARGRQVVSESLSELQLAAVNMLHEGRRQAQKLIIETRHQSYRHLAVAGATVPALLSDIRIETRQALRSARLTTRAELTSLLDHARTHAHRAHEITQLRRAEIAERARRSVQEARTSSESLWREIAGQGPQKTLSRGFALVRDQHQSPVTSAARARQARHLEIQFHDGSVTVTCRASDSEEN